MTENESRELLNQALNYIKGENKDFNKAKELLEEFIKQEEQYKNDSSKIYLNFDDMFDFILYCNFHKNDGKDIEWLSIPFLTAYSYLECIYFETNDFENANKMIDKMLEWAPMNLDGLFERSQIYLRQKDLQQFLNHTLSIYDKISKAKYMARFYRNLGYYYIEVKQLDLAYALYSASIMFEQSPNAFNEMGYINKLLGREPYKMPVNEWIKELNSNNIPVGPKESNLVALMDIYKDKELVSRPEVETKLANRLYMLTREPFFEPYHEWANKEVGFSFWYPRSWGLPNEQSRKEIIGNNCIFSAINEQNHLVYVNILQPCKDEEFESVYKTMLNGLMTDSTYVRTLLKEGILDIQYEKEIIRYRYVAFDIKTPSKEVREIHFYAIINDILMDFCTTLEMDIDFSNDSFKSNAIVQNLTGLLKSVKKNKTN